MPRGSCSCIPRAQVVSVNNPTALTEIATLNVGANLASYCDEVSCIYEHHDFGGRDNPCGYTTVVKFISDYGSTISSTGTTSATNGAGTEYLVGSAGNWSLPSYANEYEIDSTMTSPAACQTKCANTPGAAFFSCAWLSRTPLLVLSLAARACPYAAHSCSISCRIQPFLAQEALPT